MKGGKNIEYYNRLDSTNIEAWEIIEKSNQHGTVIITENQIKGRGLPFICQNVDIVIIVNLSREKILSYILDLR